MYCKIHSNWRDISLQEDFALQNYNFFLTCANFLKKIIASLTANAVRPSLSDCKTALL